MGLFEKIERQGVHGAPRKAAGAIALEPPFAPILEHRLGHDAPGRIARTEKENVIGSCDHKADPRQHSKKGRSTPPRPMAPARAPRMTVRSTPRARWPP